MVAGLTPTSPGYNPNAGGCYNSVFDPTSTFNKPGSGTSDLQATPFISEENTEAYIVTGPVSDAGAIMPMSVGRFLYQWNQRGKYSLLLGNWDPTLTVANLEDLGPLESPTGPYVYGSDNDAAQTAAVGCGVVDAAVSCSALEPATGGNPAYPATGQYITWTFAASGSYGQRFVANKDYAIGSVNQAVVNENSEWYTAYDTVAGAAGTPEVPSLVPGIRYIYNIVWGAVAGVNNASPDENAALDLVGFGGTNPITSATVSPLCANTPIGPDSLGGAPIAGGFPGGPSSAATGNIATAATPSSIIVENGFVPLALQNSVPAGHPGYADDSHCRLFLGSANPL